MVLELEGRCILMNIIVKCHFSIIQQLVNMVTMHVLFYTLQAIHVHEMPNISFASGGDTDTLDFVAYVAKDRAGLRSCFVLECGGGIAQDVITTVGQALELRFVVLYYIS